MGVYYRQGSRFLGQVADNGNQHHVLEHIGMVARVEGVAVGEHGLMVTEVIAALTATL